MTFEKNNVPFPAGRSETSVLQGERRTLEEARYILTLMEAMPELAMILNEHRQIVAVNHRFMEALGINNFEYFIGKRPGEALGCIHFGDGPDGCGTAPNCSVCGAVISIFSCQTAGKQAVGECMISLHKNGGTSLDLEATSTPLLVADKMFTVFTLKDISSEKRRNVIERTFFHDIINTAGGIRGLAEMLTDSDSLAKETEDEYKEWMLTLSDNLIEEIKYHRRLMAAERGEYESVLESIDVGTLLKEVTCLYENHEKAAGKTIRLENSAPCAITTDKPALRRIIGNMVLNALEAIDREESVRIRYVQAPGGVRIEIENPGEIPADVQLKIFKRSFSTKNSSGRGIGTYSMKLFGERYLGGAVGFTSRDGLTIFFIDLPR